MYQITGTGRDDRPNMNYLTDDRDEAVALLRLAIHDYPVVHVQRRRFVWRKAKTAIINWIADGMVEQGRIAP